jgi:5'-phosphate synthase pdxT subunit
MRAGVLALQGDVMEHRAALEALDADVIEVRSPADLEDIDALVLPGGESTTISLLLELTGLREPLLDWVARDRPTLGTCAGLVLLSQTITDGRDDQRGLGGLDIAVQRNGYGRQRFSFEASVESSHFAEPFEAVFIRAPRILSTGSSVEVLGTLAGTGAEGGTPVMVQQGSLIGCAFHPELTGDLRLHRRLLELAES